MTRKKKEKEPSRPNVVRISARVYPPNTMFFQVAAGEAEHEGKKWELSTNIATHSPIVRLPDGRWVTFDWQSLVEAAQAAGDQDAEKGGA